MTDDESSLDELIAAAARDHAMAGADARSCGWYGELLLHRFERDGDDASLVAAIARLEEAVGRAEPGADRTRWRMWLGIARGDLGRRRELPSELDRAIAEFDALLAE